MSTTISVNKQTVKELLGGAKTKPFVIPEYQRPYSWTFEQVDTLFDDIWEFAKDTGGSIREHESYFLGTIVSFENEEKEQEIIDGQQRITTLVLLLRACYTKLAKSEAATPAAKNLISQIAAGLWPVNPLTFEVRSYEEVYLTSRVINDKGNEILREILVTGKVQARANDNYSRNYGHLQERLNKVSQDDPFMIHEFIFALLTQVILLPISAESQETALTIFSTLNDRGLPLSDADIFKAKIYNHFKSSEQKDAFIADWQNLEEDAEKAGESIQSLFYYYMFYLRALNGMSETTIPGARKFYMENGGRRLYQEDLMDNLACILALLKVINLHETIEGEVWSNFISIRQTLDTLTSYPNEFWKYPVIIYYFVHHKENNFEVAFELFLKKLVAELLTRFLLMPSINFVKSNILNLNRDIVQSKQAIPAYKFRDLDIPALEEVSLDRRLEKPWIKVRRMVLKLLAYSDPEQKELLPEKWDVEHILPKKYLSQLYPEKQMLKQIGDSIDDLGNLIPLEKKINVTASNSCFSNKKPEYAKSKIAIAQKLSTSEVDIWDLDDIRERNKKLAQELRTTLTKYHEEYDSRVL